MYARTAYKIIRHRVELTAMLMFLDLLEGPRLYNIHTHPREYEHSKQWFKGARLNAKVSRFLLLQSFQQSHGKCEVIVKSGQVRSGIKRAARLTSTKRQVIEKLLAVVLNCLNRLLQNPHSSFFTKDN